MALHKIVKNTSGNLLTFLKKELEINEEYLIPSNLWFELIDNQNIYDLVTNGSVEISNGTEYLDAEEGISHLNKTQEDELYTSKRFVNKEIKIKQEDEMILSDFTDIDELGCLDINGLLTILGE